MVEEQNKYKDNKLEDRYIFVSVNGKESNKILLEKAVKNNDTVKSIVAREITKYPEMINIPEFFVKVNGKRVAPKDVKNMSIEKVEIVEIDGSIPINENVHL